MLTSGTLVTSKSQLADMLKGWFHGTLEPTIGDVGTYGRKGWIYIDWKTWLAQLNADTTREAVGAYLDDVARRGADVPWQVVLNRNGRFNKVVYRTDGRRVPGWYCYLTEELSASAGF